MTRRRVVITGLGVVSPLGLDLPTTWNAILDGQSGADQVRGFDASQHSTTFACEVKGFDPKAYFDTTTARRMEKMGLGRADMPTHNAMRMPMAYGNRLFLGGRKTFKEAPYKDEVARTGWSWGTVAEDFDLVAIAGDHLDVSSIVTIDAAIDQDIV